MKKTGILALLILLFSSCGDEEKNLAPYEERVAKAKEELIEKLVAPANGWRLDYSPVSGSGTYLILLDFEENGTVRIQSDVGNEDGYFYDQTISYRVDNGSYLELIFETYSVFHYLFEQDQATFGAEFEFLFTDDEDGELTFTSKSDLGTPSSIRLVDASSATSSLFSREQVANMLRFEGLGPSNEFGLPLIYSMQRAYFPADDFSIYWSIDQAKRVVYFDKVVSGSDFLGTVFFDDFFETGYTFESGKMTLQAPFGFDINGTEKSIGSLELTDFSETGGAPFCPGDLTDFPTYSGSAIGVGNFILTNSLYNSTGEAFVPGQNAVYSVNIPFIFDAELNSLADEGGVIYELFPEAVGFIFLFGVTSETYPSFSTGLIVEGDSGESLLYVREFESTTLFGNRLELNFTENFFLEGMPDSNVQADLETVLSEIFEGGTIYIYLTPAFGLDLYRLYNPCNKYEILLVG